MFESCLIVNKYKHYINMIQIAFTFKYVFLNSLRRISLNKSKIFDPYKMSRNFLNILTCTMGAFIKQNTLFTIYKYFFL